MASGGKVSKIHPGKGDPLSLSVALSPHLDPHLDQIRPSGVVDVWVSGGTLRWRWPSETTVEMIRGEGGAALLETFCRLATTDDLAGDVTGFVEKFGPLDIEGDGRPSCDDSRRPPRRSRPGKADPEHREPIEAYRLYARHARALQVLSVALRESTRPVLTIDVLRRVSLDPLDRTNPAHRLAERWAARAMGKDEPDADRAADTAAGMTLRSLAFALWRDEQRPLPFPVDPATLPDPLPETVKMPKGWNRQDPWRLYSLPVDIQRGRLAEEFSRHWLRPSGITPRMIWEGERPRFALDVGEVDGARSDDPARSTFRLLTLQLAAALSGGGHVYSCSICGETFSSERRRRTDRANPCPDCRPRLGSIRVGKHRDRAREGA